jgi:hypothetical protein
MKPLFAFRGLADNPQSVLAAIHRLALVGLKMGLNIILELCVAPLTDAQNGYTFDPRHDPEFALRHDCSLAHLAGRA